MEILKGVKFNKFISENRERTLIFLKSRYSELSEDDIKDVYQESSLALYLNIESGKLSELTSSLYTYFLRICINQSLKVIRSSGRTPETSFDITQNSKISESKLNDIIIASPISPKASKSPEQELMVEEMKTLVNSALNEMAEKCKQLLRSYYYEELSWMNIACLFSIKGGADSAKVQASKCRQRFEEKNKELKRLYNLKRSKKREVK